MAEKIRIHLADDHQVLVDGMKSLLHTISNFEVVGFSLDGKTLYDELIIDKADILILDISMPEKDGIEVVKEFAAKGFPCKVIILSSYDDLKLIKDIMKLGVSGYLTKNVPVKTLLRPFRQFQMGKSIFVNRSGKKYSIPSQRIFQTSTEMYQWYIQS